MTSSERLVSCLAICLGVGGWFATPASAFPLERPWLAPGVPDSLALAAQEGQENWPIWESRLHYINDIWTNVTSFGVLGAGRDPENPLRGVAPQPKFDRLKLRISWMPSFEFPPRTQNDYLNHVGFMFGCVRGLDTIVTTTWHTFQNVRESSALKHSPFYDPAARGEQQYYASFSDTSWYSRRFSYDVYNGRMREPVGLEISQTSYAWSSSFARRFIIYDFWIKNVTSAAIHDACIGLLVWPMVQNDDVYGGLLIIHEPKGLIGFLSETAGLATGIRDTLNVVWAADDDGDPLNPDAFTRESPTGVFGLRILRAPVEAKLSFNWWAALYENYRRENQRTIAEWAPREQRNPALYEGSVGMPEGQRSWYRMMRNGEIDYDQVYAAIDYRLQGWYPPHSDPQFAAAIARGTTSACLISAGPLAPISPGDSVPFTIAFLGGLDFHGHPRDHLYNFDAREPQRFLARLDFSDLILQARWAGWVFDTPGYDTDGDGNKGTMHLINCGRQGCDTVYSKGDGVPDLRAPQPPSPPKMEITSATNAVTLHWNGSIPETDIDPMSGQRDFEGYRIFAGRFNEDGQFSLVASWDKDDLQRMTYRNRREGWVPSSHPYPAGEWPELMGDPAFDPRDYPAPSFDQAFADTLADTLRDFQGRIVEIIITGRFSYWASNDYNRTNEYWDGQDWVRNIIQRVGERDTILGDDTLRYGIYEATIANLNPSVPLFFAVTAFDFGNYLVRLQSLESSPANNSAYAEPIYSANVVADSGLRVSVFPNPYKISHPDASGNPTTYYLEGYEGRGSSKFIEQDRRIHFVNLPDTATVRIYTLDGDLVREFHHPDPFLTTYSSSMGWDLVTRNAQAVVSGIYIWRVDSRLGTQIGKLVIIK